MNSQHKKKKTKPQLNNINQEVTKHYLSEVKSGIILQVPSRSLILNFQEHFAKSTIS